MFAARVTRTARLLKAFAILDTRPLDESGRPCNPHEQIRPAIRPRTPHERRPGSAMRHEACAHDRGDGGGNAAALSVPR